MMSVLRLVGIVAVLFSVCLFNGPATVEANLSLAFKALKIARHSNPANCTVGNTTYAHGQTFKLDCKTQCVCENGRHACSSLCPKEQLPAPEDTISCRSPRLVEVPGHCCKMWLCENPTADVYATCHNSSTSPWTACSRPCGLGIATRYTSTTAGCRQLSNLRLCETRKCTPTTEPTDYATLSQQQQQQEQQQRHHNHPMANGKDELHRGHHKHMAKAQPPLMEHRIRKGHECRSIQRLGPARIRLDKCVSKKLYRPKLCGQCHQHSLKCCTPSVSTTIQVELLCPLIGINDPNHYVVQRLQSLEDDTVDDDEALASSMEFGHREPPILWDTVSLEPLDQEYLQSHQIPIENKFIAVEWILKCECSKHADNCSADHNGNNNNNNYRFYNSHNNGNINDENNARARPSENNNNNNEHDNANDNGDSAIAVDGNANGSDEWQPDIIPYPQMSMRASTRASTVTSTTATAARRFADYNNNNIITNTNRITAKEHHHHYHHQQQQQQQQRT